MKTDFPQRTAYRLSDKPVPACFTKLDEHFELVLPAALPHGAATHVAVLLAENVCRMAEVELYAFLIEDPRKRLKLNYEGDADATILAGLFCGLSGGSTRPARQPGRCAGNDSRWGWLGASEPSPPHSSGRC